MNKLFLSSLLVVFFAAGCGKKKAEVKIETKKIASLKGDLPEFTSDKEEMVDNSSVNDFAFVDEDELDNNEKNSFVASAKDKEKVKNSYAPKKAANELVASADEQDFDDELGFKRVQFDFDKSSIRADQKGIVKADIHAAKKAIDQGKNVVVQGHTCQLGSAGYNLALSQRRAETVKTEMVKHGIPQTKIKTVGFGYEQPLVWSDKSERQERILELSPNRRAEVITN